MTSGKIAAQYASLLPYRRSRSNYWPSLGARKHYLAMLGTFFSDISTTLYRHATLACYKALSKSNPSVRASIALPGFSTHTHKESSSSDIGKGRGQHSLVLIFKRTNLVLMNCTADRQTKVALRANDEEELDTLEAIARSLNLCARSIHDA